jgi:hypothetical protein
MKDISFGLIHCKRRWGFIPLFPSLRDASRTVTGRGRRQYSISAFCLLPSAFLDNYAIASVKARKHYHFLPLMVPSQIPQNQQPLLLSASLLFSSSRSKPKFISIQAARGCFSTVNQTTF